MKRITQFVALLLSAMAGSFPALASSGIELKAMVEKEIHIINEKGEREIQRVPANKVIPGDEVIYTIMATNVGDKVADSVLITDPIPDHTRYVAGTASGSKTDIHFSVDGGKHYGLPGKLVVMDANGKPRPAKADDYTHIRWTLKQPLKPGDEASVWFRARLN